MTLISQRSADICALYYIRYMITQIFELIDATTATESEENWTELDLLMPAQLMNQKWFGGDHG